MNLFHKVIVSWGNTNSAPPRMLLSAVQRHKVREKVFIRREKTDDLNLRFTPPDGESQEIKCIFIADDDILVSELDVLLAYHTWKDHTDQIVGAFPRAHAYGENNQLSYVSNPEHQYSMVLTKFMVTSVDFLHHYHSGMMSGTRNYVRQQRNCEDIAFNMMVSKLTNLPPVYVRITEKLDFGGKAGLFTRSNHVQQRHDCVAWISNQFGECPLKFSSHSIARFDVDVFIRSRHDADIMINKILHSDKALVAVIEPLMDRLPFQTSVPE